MPKLFVSDIQPQMQVDTTFRVADRQLRANRQGNLYLLMQLQDRTGVISGMRWNADEKIAERFQKGTYVRVQGASQLHNGVLQLILNQVHTVDESSISEEDFEAANRVASEELWAQLGEMLETIKNSTLRSIAFRFYKDETVQRLMQIAPAGVKTHHAYPGGLLEHVVSLMRLADLVATHYETLDRDMLMVGAMLHDIGKIEELQFEGELTYSDSGQLLGHLVQGIEMVNRYEAQLRSEEIPLDQKDLLRLKHIIVSHHGYLEHGSPKVPMTLEALAFHYLDELDAKLNASMAMIQSDRTRDAWTPFNPTLGRKIFKPTTM
jgi:3'-5' exoribonuclease